MATLAMGNASSPGTSSSASSVCSHENYSSSPLRSPDTTTEDVPVAGGEKPYLQILEQPGDKFHFRYATEMQGTHGAILGVKSHNKGRGKSYPRVKLCNYKPTVLGEEVIIRCSLYTADKDESSRVLHVHRLVGKQGGAEKDDPHDVPIKAPHYTASFQNMIILFTKKEKQVELLVEKKQAHIKRRFTDASSVNVRMLRTQEFKAVATKELSNMNLNVATLKFEALVDNGQGAYTPICPAVFSTPISNKKNPQTNELKICRVDRCMGSCEGNQEVFMFVEKIVKKNIKVRFYEEDENKDLVWSADADFGPDDVHHQYGIVFKTPPYRDPNIKENRVVFFQLERPTDNAVSEPRVFEYTPNMDRLRALGRKRPRQDDSSHYPVSLQDFQTPSPRSVPTTAPLVSSSADFVDVSFSKININPEFGMSDDISLSLLDDVLMPEPEEERASSLASSTASLTQYLEKLPSAEQQYISQVCSLGRLEEYLKLQCDDELLQINASLNEKSDMEFDGWPVSFDPLLSKGRLSPVHHESMRSAKESETAGKGMKAKEVMRSPGVNEIGIVPYEPQMWKGTIGPSKKWDPSVVRFQMDDGSTKLTAEHQMDVGPRRIATFQGPVGPVLKPDDLRGGYLPADNQKKPVNRLKPDQSVVRCQMDDGSTKLTIEHQMDVGPRRIATFQGPVGPVLKPGDLRGGYLPADNQKKPVDQVEHQSLVSPILKPSDLRGGYLPADNQKKPVNYVDHQGPRVTPSKSSNEPIFAGQNVDRHRYPKNAPPSQILSQKKMMYQPNINLRNHQNKVVVATPEMGPAVTARRRAALTELNIAVSVNKTLDELATSRSRVSSKEQLQRCLRRLFAYCVGDNEDSVLHVLASSERVSPLLNKFIRILQLNNISDDIVNYRNKKQETALHVAVRRGCVETVAQLVAAGANVDLTDSENNSACHLAVLREASPLPVLEVLLRKRPNLSIHNADGLTALHLAVSLRRSDIISTLLIKSEEEGFPPDIINHRDRKNGNTALHIAVQNRFKEVVNLLLNFEEQIDVNIKNFAEKTPLAFVYEEEDADAKEIQQQLLLNQADPKLVQSKKEDKTVECKNEWSSDSETEIIDSVDVDDGRSAYAREWEHLQFLDIKTINKLCPLLDEKDDWIPLVKKFGYSDSEIDYCKIHWSPALLAFSLAALNKPQITVETVRDQLLTMPPHLHCGAQYIDDMILHRMGL